MGQCIFSRDLVVQLGINSVRSVALCTKDDAVLSPLLEPHEGCEVVVLEGKPEDLDYKKLRPLFSCLGHFPHRYDLSSFFSKLLLLIGENALKLLELLELG